MAQENRYSRTRGFEFEATVTAGPMRDSGVHALAECGPADRWRDSWKFVPPLPPGAGTDDGVYSKFLVDFFMGSFWNSALAKSTRGVFNSTVKNRRRRSFSCSMIRLR